MNHFESKKRLAVMATIPLANSFKNKLGKGTNRLSLAEFIRHDCRKKRNRYPSSLVYQW